MINKTILQGRLTRDPELRTTNTGVEVCSFTVAWSKEYKENKTECFLNCVAWRQTGVFISQYFQKGKEIVVEGTLTTRKYQDKDGNNRTIMELIVDQGHFCGKKSDDSVSASSAQYSAPQQTQPPIQQQFDSCENVDDGDLPF